MTELNTTNRKFRFQTAREGNAHLRQLCLTRGIPFYSENHISKLNHQIAILEGRFDDIQVEPTKAPAATAQSAAAPAPAPAAKPAPAAPAPAVSAAPAPVKETFGDKVAALMTAERISKAEAIKLAVARHSDLHAEWMRGDTSKIDVSHQSASPKNFVALVEAAVAGGRSKAEAVCYIVSAFPAAYSEWRKTGDTSKI